MNDRTHLLNINVPKGSNIRTTVTPIRMFTNMDYVRFFSDSLQRLATDKSLTRTDIVVMLYCISICDFYNEFTVSQATVASECGISRTYVNKAFKTLLEREWLIIINKIGKQNVYLINPSISFKTRAINYNGMVERFEELRVGIEDAD